MMRRCLLVIAFLCPGVVTPAWGGTFSVLEAKDLVREGGRPTVFSESFTVLDPTAPYTLRIANGGRDAQYAKVSSAVVNLNGTEIVGPRDWNQNVTLIERPLVLAADNELAVELRGRPGGGITLEIVGVDEVAPELTLALEPPDPVLAEAPRIALAYTDRTAGVDLESLRVAVDGTQLTAGCGVTDGSASCPPPELPHGLYEVSAEIADRAGNVAAATATFELLRDREPPVVTITSPVADALVSIPVVTVRGTATDDGEVVRVLVNGAEASVDGNTWSATAEIAAGNGPRAIDALAIDATGKVGGAAVTVLLDTTPPRFSSLEPADGVVINADRVTVRGEVDEAHGVAELRIDGVVVATDAAGTFSAEATLAEGANQLTLTARDEAGNESSATLTIERFSVPSIAITSPADQALVAGTTVEVRGTVSAGVTAVTVNGVTAALDGTELTATVPLHEGANLLSATARDALGRAASASVIVARDTTPPKVALTSPADGAVLHDSAVAVSGLVIDGSMGFATSAPVSVSVNGAVAELRNGGFFADGLPLAPGENAITAVAVDESGNSAQASITVVFEPPAGARLRVVSGDGQTAPARSALGAPLEVRLRDAAGAPVAGATLLFAVAEGDGSLDGGRRQILATTDALGRATAAFTLGGHAGVGNQRVEVTAPGLSPAVEPAILRASALAGAPAHLLIDSGDQQIGAAGQRLPRPFVVVATDDAFNRLAGVDVTFRVLRGGTFDDGAVERTVPTDALGRATAAFTLGPEDGLANNVVRAELTGEPRITAGFVASGRVVGDPAATSLSGLVLDNTDLPVPGATIHLKGTALTTVSDDEGFFHIAPAPVGIFALRVDGSTVRRPGPWPTLEFEVTLLPGLENGLGRPIFLLPLDGERGLEVSATEGGRLELAELPGFALEVAPGSVTFPDGGRSGTVRVTVVHQDKVPMTPNFAQQPRFVITIQPAGAHFDPPARLILPNLDGLAPGQVTGMYSFDHDLGRFVSIGPGAVSEDGTSLVSMPGFGVVKAGWHCGGDPAGSGTPHQCGECEKCVDDDCVPDPDKDGLPCVDEACTICEDGDCRPVDDPPAQKVMVIVYDDPLAKNVNDPYVLTVDLATALEDAAFFGSGSVVLIEVVDSKHHNEHPPRENPPTYPDKPADYNAILDAHDICGRLNRGEIDEVWIWSDWTVPFFESRLAPDPAH